MGTPLKVLFAPQGLTNLVEKSSKERVNFLKIGVQRGLFGKLVEWNMGIIISI